MTKRWAFAALSTASLFWGASFVLGKVVLAVLPPGPLLALRFALASVLFIPVVLRNHPSKADLGWLVLAAFLTVPATFGLQFFGLALTSASHASLLVGMVPAVMVGVTFFVFRQKVPGKDALAALAAVLGVIVLVIGGHDDSRRATWTGDLMVLGSTAAIVGWILVQRRLSERYPPVTLTAWVTVLGTIFLLPLLVQAEPSTYFSMSASAWTALAALALFPTVLSYLLWNWGARDLSAHQTGIFLALEPFAGVLFAVAFLGESFSWTTAVAGMLILGAMVLTTLPGRSRS